MEMGRLRSGAHNATVVLPKKMAYEDTGNSQPNQTQSLDSKLDAVLVAIDQSRSSLENKIDTVAADLSLLHADHRKLVDKVNEAERVLTQLQPEVKTLDESVQSLLERVRFLEGRAEDAEGRSRRNNIRVVGVPEGSEGQDATKYMETWLREVIPQATHTQFFSLERAHRVPARRPPPGSYPRPIVMRLLHYRDRDAILSEARKRRDIRIGDAKIMFFPDYTLAVQHQRNSFMKVKRKLREINYRYSLLFPARLRVEAQGKTHFFEDPQHVWDWLESIGHGADSPPPEEEADSSRSAAEPGRRRRPRMKRRMYPKSTPHLEQMIKERQESLRAAESLTVHRSPERIGTDSDTSASDKGSYATWPSSIDGNTLPRVTPQSVDELI